MINILQKKPGFNLVEMIVVIGIIGILAGVLTPSVSRYVKGLSLNGEAKTLSGALRDAQERSITEQKQYFLRFSTDASPAYYDMIRINNSVEEFQKKYELNSSITLTLQDTITENKIAFSPDGGPSSNGNITLSNGSANKIINVSPAGFISAQ